MCEHGEKGDTALRGQTLAFSAANARMISSYLKVGLEVVDAVALADHNCHGRKLGHVHGQFCERLLAASSDSDEHCVSTALLQNTAYSSNVQARLQTRSEAQRGPETIRDKAGAFERPPTCLQQQTYNDYLQHLCHIFTVALATTCLERLCSKETVRTKVWHKYSTLSKFSNYTAM